MAVSSAAAVAGCGAGATVDPVAEAAQATSLAHGVRLSLNLSMTLPGGQTVTTPGSGAFDLRGRRGRMTFDFSKLSGLAGGRLGGPGHATLQELIVYPDVYMRAPFLTRAIPGHKPWVKVDAAAAAKRETGFDPTRLTTQNGPVDQLQQLRATGGVKRVGSDTVRGVPTTHYRGTVDLRKAAARVGAGKQAVERLIKATGTSSYPVDVWIDAQRRVRRERAAFSFDVGGQRLSMTVAMDLYDFGGPVAVSAPPAGQVFDATP